MVTDCHCQTCQLDKIQSSVNALRTEMRQGMSDVQDRLDALTTAVESGVQELRDEINRLASLPPEQVDFSRLQSIADALTTDNIPAAPVEPPAEPVA